MSIIKGIISGIKSGILIGINAVFGREATTTLDFSVPATIGVGGNGTFAHTNASDEWLLQESSGTYANAKGGTAFTNGSGLQGQTAVGLWDGSSYIARNAFEVRQSATTNDFLELVSDSTTLDSNNEDIAACIVFRSNGGGGIETLLGKRGPGSGFAGWEIRWAGGGTLSVTVDDGATIFQRSVAGDHADGAWHYCVIWYDDSAKTLSVRTDLTTHTAVAAGLSGSLTNTGTLQAAKWSLGSSDNPKGDQYTYIGGTTGANAEAFFDEAIVLPGSDPTGLLTTQTRASTISVPVAEGYIAHFAEDTLPIGYHSAFTDTNKLGLWCNSAIENLQPYSEEFTTGWAAYNMSVASDDVDAPDGFRSADKLTQTGAGGRTQRSISGLTELTEYTVSFWARTDDGGHDQLTYIYNNAGTARIKEETTAITDSWSLVEFQFTTEAGQTAAYHRFHPGLVTDSDKVFYIWGLQTNLGKKRAVYIRTEGAADTLSASSYEASGSHIHIPYGETAVTLVLPSLPLSGFSIIYDTGTSTTDRRYCYIETTGNLRMRVYDSVGTSEDNVTHSSSPLSVDTQYSFRHLWDSRAAGVHGFEQVGYVNGSLYDGGASPWEGSASVGYASTIRTGPGDDIIIQSITTYDDTLEE